MNSFYNNNFKGNNKIHLFLLIIIFFNYSLSIECPRSKPIFKDNECNDIYCQPKEYETNICLILNPFIKSQWLNNINFIDNTGIMGISTTSNSRGDLFIIAEGYNNYKGSKFIFGFSKDGTGLFHNNINDSYYSREKIDFPYLQYSEIFKIVNIEEKEYLLSTYKKDKMFLIDYENKNFTYFNINKNVYYSDNIFNLKGYYEGEDGEEDENIYFTSYIYCDDLYPEIDEDDYDFCYLGLKIFKFNLTNIETILDIPDKIRVHYKSRLSCFQNKDLYIQCIYNPIEKINNKTEIINHAITLFNHKTLKIEFNEILEEKFDIDCIFDSTIHLKENVFITGYSYNDNKNVIKLLLKTFKIEKNNDKNEISLEDYLKNVQYIEINKDQSYLLERGQRLSKRNSMTKISETKFAIILNDYNGVHQSTSSNRNLIIIIANIFDESFISLRHYKIDFGLYNLVVIEDTRGYTLNSFFGVLLEVGQSLNNIDMKNSAIFLTFGYINSTYDQIPIDKNLKENNTNSVINLGDYINEIENNLFGYKFIGVQILDLPDINKCGYFINNATNEKIKVGDVVNRDTVLRFILQRKLNVEGDFEIDFAGVVQESKYDEMKSNAERIDIFPENNSDIESQFYHPEILNGRVIKYRFEIRCYDSCNGCYKMTNNISDHQCIKCKQNYFFQEGTNNCFESLDGYYFNNFTKTFKKCHSACAACNGPLNSKYMNCLTCKEGYTHYHSNNCLKCTKYISPDLTECLYTIPDGYFLANPKSGVLGECHELCLTCEDFPSYHSTNCLECKYKNSKFVPEYEGDCPSEEEKIEKKEIEECPRNKPILRNNNTCADTFCKKEEFEDKTCSIKNSIAKTQWINNIQRLGEGNISFISLDYGINDELILFGQERENNIKQNFVFASNKNGEPFFYNKNRDSYYFIKNVHFPEDLYLKKVKLVKNYEYNKTFLLSTQIQDRMFRINYDNYTTDIYELNYTSYSSGDIFTLKNSKIYFNSHIYCVNNENNKNNSTCYPYLRKFIFESDKSQMKVIDEHVEKKEINPEATFYCMEGYKDYIQCIFTEIDEGINNHILGLFNSKTLFLSNMYIIGQNFGAKPFLDSMIKLNDEAFIIAYSTEKNIIKVKIKTLKYNNVKEMISLNDYITDIPYININEDDFYKFQRGSTDRNDLCKINNEKFAILMNSFNDLSEDIYENPNIVIYIFSLYNYNSNINIRRYSINFKMYNMANHGKILGYNLGQFFGIFIELTSPKNQKYINSAFITFGYVNSTEPNNIYDKKFIPENSLESKYINISNYIENISNNLFGYEFIGVLILSLPDESIGYFMDSKDEIIKTNQTLDLNASIRFKLSNNYKSGKYSIIFGGIVREPDYEIMNNYSEQIETYPKDSIISEKDFYTPKILIGKTVNYTFRVINETDCYPSCSTCQRKSNDDNNHLCKTCKDGYYFKENTNDCYKEIKEHYYFNEEKKVFSPCHKNCLTCKNKKINSTYMNCLSCENGLKFYDESKNCLNCSKYVNFLQTKCINEIPDGYYLFDKRLGIIKKCHDLCKTCTAGPYFLYGNFYMNCESCKYNNIYFEPPLKGDCPLSELKENDEEPINGECPRDKPILKNNKCQMTFCTAEEYEKGTCKILNKYIQNQWMNKFHIFGDKATSVVASDISDKGDVFFLAQKEDEQYNKHKYIFGFSSNGTGLIYNQSNNQNISFKEISYQFPTFTDKIKYIKINGKGYLINILKDKKIYLIDYSNNEVYIQNKPAFDYIPHYFDTMIRLRGKDNIYFFDYIYCEEASFLKNCYMRLINYKIENKEQFFIENSSPVNNIEINPNTKLTCVENTNYFIQCTYTTLKDNQHILSLFNHNNLDLYNSFVLENNFIEKATFDSMIEIKDNVCVIAYSLDPNVIHVIFKKISVDLNKNYILLDYIVNIPYVNINEESLYEFKGGNSYRNSLYKIDDDEFIMLINDFKNNGGYSTLNTGLVIIYFRVYNFERNIIVRHYRIDFRLYNMYIDGDVMGYKLNGFLGALIELTSPDDKFVGRAAFLTFGYVNSTDDITSEQGTKELIKDKKNLKVNEYITGIENNLFGYDFIGVKILSLPEESKVGYFINVNNKNERINLNDIIDINSELNLVLNENPAIGNYSISFAGLVKEPELKILNSYSIKVENYPKNSTPEKYLNEERILMGKEFKYNFIINNKEEENKCYKNCETCIRPSNNINEQDCLTCKEGFYFKDNTRNCFDKIEFEYYFNEKTKSFSPCYKDCYTCSNKEISSEHMNCKTCHNLYKFYEKSTNCLKCEKYVNFLQTQCIDKIPEGYFLLDENFGIIGKCHSLCKTCKYQPVEINKQIHMNCETCLYENKSYKKLVEGNCPESSDKLEDNGNNINNSNNDILIVCIIIIIVLIILVFWIIACKKCFRNKGINSIDNKDYHIIDGKNIPFDDENSFGEIN